MSLCVWWKNWALTSCLNCTSNFLACVEAAASLGHVCLGQEGGDGSLRRPQSRWSSFQGSLFCLSHPCVCLRPSVNRPWVVSHPVPLAMPEHVWVPMDAPVRRPPCHAHDLCKHSYTTCRELCPSTEVFVYMGDIPHHTELKL